MDEVTKEKRLSRLRRLTRLLDASFTIPGVGYKLGFDGLIGLVPGVGDLLTLIPSLYIIFEGSRLGLPRRVVVRMVLNVVLETAIGSVPILGDVFDFFWKANIRNMHLIEKHVP